MFTVYTPLYGCGESDQTMCLILFECKGSLSIPSDAAHQLRERICEAETNCFPNMHVRNFCTIQYFWITVVIKVL